MISRKRWDPLQGIEIAGCVLLAGCRPGELTTDSATDTASETYVDPDSTGPGPWEPEVELAPACEACPESAVECACNCSGWDPDNMVSYVGGVYGMDGGDVVGLIYDPLPLVFCDDARLEKDGGGYEVVDADAGELLYELGLRDGDIPLELNGFSLETSGDVVEAISELWILEGEDQFELYVLRGVNYITLDYSISGTL